MDYGTQSASSDQVTAQMDELQQNILNGDNELISSLSNLSGRDPESITDTEILFSYTEWNNYYSKF